MLVGVTSLVLGALTALLGGYVIANEVRGYASSLALITLWGSAALLARTVVTHGCVNAAWLAHDLRPS